MKNPWTLERLNQYLGQEESFHLDFKSSRPLASGNKNEAKKFFDGLSRHVSAFLNSEGGILLIGMEEQDRQNQPDVATGLSAGVPRKLFTAQQVENSICDRIHPSVAAYVRVCPIAIGEADGEKLLAFAVEISRGATAYQAEDKIYYVRRGYESDAMEDKDIRLRMLSDDHPRAALSITVSSDDAINQYRQKITRRNEDITALESRLGKPYDQISIEEKLADVSPPPSMWGEDRSEIKVHVSAINIGNRTIREYAIEWHLLDSRGLECRSSALAPEVGKPHLVHIVHPAGSDESFPLFPSRSEPVLTLWLRRGNGYNVDSAQLSFVATIYLDNGPSSTFEFTLNSEIALEFKRTAYCLEYLKRHSEMPEHDLIFANESTDILHE